MSTAAVLKGSQMSPIAHAVRAYVMPVDRSSGAVTAFDPAVQGQFDLDSPPAPLLDLGWVENFKRTSPTRYEPLRGGARGTVTAQYRSQMEALVEFDLPAWGKLQMAVAGGGQRMNVLATVPATTPQGSGGVALSAAYVQDGSTDRSLRLEPEELAAFDVGDIVAVDVDYAGTSGYLGSGIPGTYLTAPLNAAGHVDLVRRVSFNLGRVVVKTPFTLQVLPPLPAGAPAGFGVQKVVAFVDREGGNYFQEWSAVFVVPVDSGGRVCFFYPRLQAAASARETQQELAAPLFSHMLHASLVALQTTDPNDGESVLCYRSYFPPASAGL